MLGLALFGGDLGGTANPIDDLFVSDADKVIEQLRQLPDAVVRQRRLGEALGAPSPSSRSSLSDMRGNSSAAGCIGRTSRQVLGWDDLDIGGSFRLEEPRDGLACGSKVE